MNLQGEDPHKCNQNLKLSMKNSSGEQVQTLNPKNQMVGLPFGMAVASKNT